MARRRIPPRVARALAFAGVLLVISTLVLVLFQEAEAVEMRFADTPAQVTEPTPFQLLLKIDKGQRVPITALEIIIERQAADAFTKAGAAVAARAECPINPITGYSCPSDTPLLRTGVPNAITSVVFADATQQDPDGPSIPAQDAFGQGQLAGTTTGYGFAAETGYGTPVGGPVPFTAGTGYGYGVGTATLWLRFDVTVAACVQGGLPSGSYFATAIARTGMPSLIGDLSSPFTAFSVSCPGGDPLPTAGDAAASPVTPPEGAAASYAATLNGGHPGTVYSVTVPDATVTRVDLTLRQTLRGANLGLTRWDGANEPSGIPEPAALDAVAAYVEIAISPSTQVIEDARIVLNLDAGQVTLPDHAYILRWNDDAWQPHAPATLVLTDPARFEANLDVPCCGLWALGYDATPPTVSVDWPDGPWSGQVTISARAEDDLGIERVELLVDNQTVANTTGAPYTFVLDTAAHGDGEHTIIVRAVDATGWTGRDSTTAEFRNA